MPDPHIQTTVNLTSCYREGGQRQYDRNTREGLLKSLSKCHDVNQAIIRSETSRDERITKIENRRLRDAIIVAAVTALLANIPQIFSWIAYLTAN